MFVPFPKQRAPDRNYPGSYSVQFVPTKIDCKYLWLNTDNQLGIPESLVVPGGVHSTVVLCDNITRARFISRYLNKTFLPSSRPYLGYYNLRFCEWNKWLCVIGESREILFQVRDEALSQGRCHDPGLVPHLSLHQF